MPFEEVEPMINRIAGRLTSQVPLAEGGSLVVDFLKSLGYRHSLVR
jgi:hypothetical protein